MRYFVIVMLLVLLLSGCMSNKYYTNKGVSYFEQPVKELDAFYNFNNPPVPEAVSYSMPVPGFPIRVNDKDIIAVENLYLLNDVESAYSTVYSCDAQTNTITDSLVIMTEGVKQAYRRLAYDKDIFVIGTKDSLCNIYKIDTDLEIIGEYPTSIQPSYIVNTSIYDGRLRIIVVEADHNIVMYELPGDTLQQERKRLLLKGFNTFDVVDNELWCFTVEDTSLVTARLDINAYDPNPVFKSFSLKLPAQEKPRVFNIKAAGETVYLSYFNESADGGYTSQLISFDYQNGTKNSRDFAGRLSYDVAKKGNKTYLFRNTVQKKKEIMTVAELTPELTEVNPQASFFKADREMAKNIIQFMDNKFYLIGIYEQKTGEQKIEITDTGKKVKKDMVIPVPFLGIIDLQ